MCVYIFKLRLQFVRPVEQKPLDIYGNEYVYMCVYMFMFRYINLFICIHNYISQRFMKKEQSFWL